MSGPRPTRCPDCGGNLYLEPDLVEAMADLVCLQCSRRFRPGDGPSRAPAWRRSARDHGSLAPADPAGDPQ